MNSFEEPMADGQNNKKNEGSLEMGGSLEMARSYENVLCKHAMLVSEFDRGRRNFLNGFKQEVSFNEIFICHYSLAVGYFLNYLSFREADLVSLAIQERDDFHTKEMLECLALCDAD